MIVIANQYVAVMDTVQLAQPVRQGIIGIQTKQKTKHRKVNLLLNMKG
jgi:hypothetical protein